MTQKVNFLLTAKDRTAAAFDSVDRRLQSLDKAAVGLAAGGIAAVGVGLAVLTRNAFKTNDELGKIADTIGITTQELAGLRQAAQLTGLGTDSLDKAIQKLTRSTGDAIRGTQTQVDAFERLGISVQDFARLDTGEQFNLIADRIQNLGTRSEQAAVAAALFGREGINLLNTLDLGRDGLEAITAEMEAFGVALGRADVAQIEAANDSITRAQAAAQGLGNRIAVGLAPFIEELGNRFADAAAESDGFAENLATAGEIGVTALSFLGDRVQDVYRGFLVVQAVVAQVEASTRSFFNIGGQSDIDDAIARVDAAFSELDESLEAGRVGAELRGQIADIRAASRERAQAVAAGVADAQARRTGAGADIGESVQERNARRRAEEAARTAAERAAEAGRRSLARLEQSLQTEEERLAESYERRQQIIADNLPGPEQEARRNELLLQVEEDYQRQRRELYGLNLNDELEAERERYEARKSLALEILEDEEATAERRAQVLADIEKEYQDAVTRISEQGYTERQKFAAKSTADQVKDVTGKLVELTQGTAQNSKAMFRLNKLAAIANATINTAEGVTKTLAAYPYPINVALAALSAAAGVAQINAIRSTTYDGGGGGTTPSLAGAVPVINDQPAQEAQPQAQQGGDLGGSTFQVVINGNFYGNEEAISDLLDAIEERINEGDRVFIDANSRQAAAIRSGG